MTRRSSIVRAALAALAAAGLGVLPGTAAAQELSDPCSLLTAEEVAAHLDIDVARSSPAGTPGVDTACAFSDSDQDVDFTVLLYQGDKQKVKRYCKVRGGFDAERSRVKKLGTTACVLVQRRTLEASTEELDVEPDFYVQNAYNLIANLGDVDLQLVVSGRFDTLRDWPRKATTKGLVALARTAEERL